MQSLAVLDEADRALALTDNFVEIREIRDKAEAVRRYAQSAALGLDVQNRAAEVKLRAERQAGKLLRQLTLRGGDRRSGKRNERLKLDDLGITPNQSTRWQIQASVSDEAFGAYVRETCTSAKELTSAGLMRLAKRLREESRARRGDSTEAFESFASEPAAPKFEEVAAPAYLRARTRAHSNWDRPGTGQPEDLISDLRNHHQLLMHLLRPVCAGEGESMELAQRRAVAYLMSQVRMVVEQLDDLFRRGIVSVTRTEHDRTPTQRRPTTLARSFPQRAAASA
jgi:hypothetical protein